MAELIRIHPKLERRLNALERQGNTPAVAATRARQIIGALIQGEGATGPGLMRARNDRRVKNSLKFNLGQGFRLICIKNKKDITVMFVGDHDSCDAWLNTHTQKRPNWTSSQMAVFTVDRRPMDERDNEAPPPSEDEIMSRDIPEYLLRLVFRGLCAPG